MLVVVVVVVGVAETVVAAAVEDELSLSVDCVLEANLCCLVAELSIMFTSRLRLFWNSGRRPDQGSGLEFKP